MVTFLRYIYSGLFYLALPVLLLRQLWRARLAPAYAKRWSERFALVAVPEEQRQGIWLHAVSLGEFMAARGLIEALLQKFPQLPMLITTTTPTGSLKVQQTFGERVQHQYLPYDLPDAVSRFLGQIQPRLGIIMETELWPNLFAACQHRDIPLLLANARLSARSAKGYQRICRITQRMLQAVHALAAQSPVDAERFIAVGMDATQVQVLGNLKFNQSIPADAKSLGEQLRSSWGRNRSVWIAASTHEGEETQILAAHAKICEMIPDVLLLLVPRHPERFDKVAQLVAGQGYCVQRRSQETPDPSCQVFIGDSMGELMMYYAAADVAFVGGSLMPIGGHTPLEPIALGVPSVMGPHIFKMQAIADLLLQHQAMIAVDDADSLAAQITALLSDRQQCAAIVSHATVLLEENRGAVEKHVQWVDELLHSQ